ncbi:MAG: outer membrane beta-barrel protein, partial [Ferruginibacter sp.]
KASPTLTLSMHGFMRTNGLQSFYQLKNYGSANFNVNKSFLKRKASVVLAINDIFNTRNVQFKIQQAGIYAIGERLNDNRKIGLTLRYNFGIKPKEENKGFMNMPADIGK